jgi:hypothetical protein
MTSGQTSSLSQTMMNAGDGSLGATIGTSGFVGQGDNTGRFIGNQNASSQRMLGSGQQFSQLQSLIGNDQFTPDSTSTSSQKQLARPVMRLGFTPPQPAPLAMQNTIQSRLISLPQLGERAAGVNALADETGRVTLTGRVGSEDDRKLVEMLVRLEPGVRSVQNDLKVTAP